MNHCFEIRKATNNDIPSIVNIYNEIHLAEEKGTMHIGWARNVYPTKDTAEKALQRGDLFVCEMDGTVCASAIINKNQLDSYSQGMWSIEAADTDVMVLHTLTVSPSLGRKGIGHKFVAFYEDYALRNHCHVLRIDTQEQNTAARHLYAKLGFMEAGIIDCTFQGMRDIKLVLLEKSVGREKDMCK